MGFRVRAFAPTSLAARLSTSKLKKLAPSLAKPFQRPTPGEVYVGGGVKGRGRRRRGGSFLRSGLV